MAGLKKARRAAAAKQAVKQRQPQARKPAGYQTADMKPAAEKVNPYVMTTGDMGKPKP